jgi:hypothetical protein
MHMSEPPPSLFWNKPSTPFQGCCKSKQIINHCHLCKNGRVRVQWHIFQDRPMCRSLDQYCGCFGRWTLMSSLHRPYLGTIFRSEVIELFYHSLALSSGNVLIWCCQTYSLCNIVLACVYCFVHWTSSLPEATNLACPENPTQPCLRL